MRKIKCECRACVYPDLYPNMLMMQKSLTIPFLKESTQITGNAFNEKRMEKFFPLIIKFLTKYDDPSAPACVQVCHAQEYFLYCIMILCKSYPCHFRF